MATTPETENHVAESSTPGEDPLEPQQKKHDREATADLEKITDYEEDKIVASQDIANAVSFIEDKHSQEQKRKLEREKELAQVKIRKEDVELIITEMEITKTIAERTLREHNGDIFAALTALTN